MEVTEASTPVPPETTLTVQPTTRSRLRVGQRSLLATVAVACVLAASLSAPRLLAQNVRVSGNTVVQYVEMRPLVTDSASCVGTSAVCRLTSSDSPVYTAPAIQDLTLSVWGIGRGVRAYAQLRGRAVVGGEEGPGGGRAQKMQGRLWNRRKAAAICERTPHCPNRSSTAGAWT